MASTNADRIVTVEMNPVVSGSSASSPSRTHNQNQNQGSNDRERSKRRPRVKLFSFWFVVSALGLTFLALGIVGFSAKLWFFAVPFVGNALYDWFFFIAAVFGSLIVCRLLAKFIVFGLRHINQFMDYLSFGLKNPITGVLIGVVLTIYTYNQVILTFRYDALSISTLQRIAILIIVASLLWVCKAVLVKIMAQKFDRNSYFVEVRDALFAERVLQRLLGIKKKDSGATVNLSRLARLRRMPRNSHGNSTPRVSNPVPNSGPNAGATDRYRTKREDSTVSSGLGEFLSMKRAAKYQLGSGISEEDDIESIVDRIWDNCELKPEEALTRESLKPKFKKTSHVEEVMRLFDANLDDMVTQLEVKNHLAVILNARRTLLKRLSNRENLSRLLDNGMGFMVFVILLFIIFPLLFQIDITGALLPLSSFILALSFVFSQFIRDVFEAMVFLFSAHSFDLGDYIAIGGPDEDWLKVIGIGVLQVTVRHLNGMIEYRPTADLLRKRVVNFKRSPAPNLRTSLHLSSTTTKEQLDSLRESLSIFCDQYSNLLDESVDSRVILVRSLRADVHFEVLLAVKLRETETYQSEGWLTIRQDLLQHVAAEMKRLGIHYHIPTQHVKMEKEKDE